SSNIFSYDDVPPTSGIITPPNNEAYSTIKVLSTISGTAADDFSGVTGGKIKIWFLGDANDWSLPGGTSYYWTGVSWSSQSVYELGVSSLTYDWSYWYYTASFDWKNQKVHYVNIRMYDLAGNIQPLGVTHAFKYDTTSPNVTISVPQPASFWGPANNLTTISGQATDEFSGVDRVWVQIKN
ncbi:MAG: hypothetical protein ABIL76_00170, partial [candidate division WOR-3 bacterium]